MYFILYSNYKSKGYSEKGHQNNLQTSKIIVRRDRPPPGSLIPESATHIPTVTCDVGFYGFILGITQTWSPLKTSEDTLTWNYSWYDVHCHTLQIFNTTTTPHRINRNQMLLMSYMLKASIVYINEKQIIMTHKCGDLFEWKRGYQTSILHVHIILINIAAVLVHVFNYHPYINFSLNFVVVVCELKRQELVC